MSVEKDEIDVKEYMEISKKAEEYVNELFKSKFNLSKSVINSFTLLNGNKINTPTKVLWLKPKNKKEPTIWMCESILPGNINETLNTWVKSKERLIWDTSISYSNTLQLSKKNKDLFILHTATKSQFGGAISPRDFVDLVRIERDDMSNRIIGKSIQFERFVILIECVYYMVYGV